MGVSWGHCEAQGHPGQMCHLDPVLLAVPCVLSHAQIWPQGSVCLPSLVHVMAGINSRILSCPVGEAGLGLLGAAEAQECSLEP